jgi:hypothetical protein
MKGGIRGKLRVLNQTTNTLLEDRWPELCATSRETANGTFGKAAVHTTVPPPLARVAGIFHASEVAVQQFVLR